MTRRESRNPLEHQRLLRLAREYRQKGYSVTLHPSPEQLPPSLSNCSLDLLAVSDTKVVAAVRTKENLTLNGSEDLRRISESVEKLPGWEFELVITNARKKSD